MSALNELSLPGYLQSRRWFGGKARTIQRATVVEHGEFLTPSSAHSYSVDLAEVRYQEGATEHYLLTTFQDPSSGELHEAMADPHFPFALFDLIRRGEERPLGSVKLRGEWLPRGLELPAFIQVRPLSLEQSNSSVVLGEQLILKLLRRVEPGIHPEYEMGKVLTERGFMGAPRLLGALQLEGPMGTTLAVVHEYFPHAADGFRYAQEVLAASEEIPSSFLQEMALLGQRTAQMHRVLGSVTDSPAFAPEPLRGEDFQSWSASIIGELGVSFALGKERLPALSHLHDGLAERLTKLAHVRPSGMAIRVHGDFHLGQTLRVNGRRGDFKIFDFEGEPARSLIHRREKHSPLKDVAGMFRSFAYAEATVGQSRPRRLRALKKAFLSGYTPVLEGTGLLPEGETFWVLLEALELEKLLYELRYELQNRPDWVRIPADQLSTFPLSSGQNA